MPKTKSKRRGSSSHRSGGFLQAVRLDLDLAERPDVYPFNVPSLRNLERLELEPGLTFFVGENGSGKSTLLEAIAVKLGINAEGGSRNYRFSTAETHSNLKDILKIERIRYFSDCFFLRAESFYNVATYAESLAVSPGGRSLHHQSHGESFMSFFMNRLFGDGLYLFDEPEAALSPQRQMAVIPLLHRLLAEGSQIIIATHSPILLAYPNALIYEFSEHGIRKIAYEETEHFMVTRDFLNRHKRMIEMLIEEEGRER